jgi:putative phage-type endonuclease
MTASPSWLPSQLAGRTEVYPDHAAWLAARRDGADYPVGGTTASALIGRSRWRGPWDVWAQYHAAEGYQASEPDQATVAPGLWWEPRIAEWYRDHKDAEIWTPPAIVRHAILPWALASIDGIVMRGGEVGLLEIKTARSRDGWAPDGAEAETATGAQVAPLDYLIQIYWYLGVTGLPWCDLVVMFGPQDMRTYRIHADRPFQAGLFRAVTAARTRHLVNAEPPPVDATAACLASLLAIDRTGETPATVEVLDAAAEYERVKAIRADAQKVEKGAKNILLAAMGDHVTHTVDDRRAVWLTGSRLYTKLPKEGQ